MCIGRIVLFNWSPFFFFSFSFLVPSRAPSNVRVSNVRFDQLKVQWNALPQQFANGRLLGYTVYYYEYYNSYVVKSVSTRSPYVNMVILRGLKAASRYQIAVAAFTSKGAGTQSYWLYVTTGIFFLFLFCVVLLFFCFWHNANYHNYYLAESASGQDAANPAFWSATRAGKKGSCYPLEISHVGPIYILYWPSLFGQDDWILASFFFAFSLTSTTSQKKNFACI